MFRQGKVLYKHQSVTVIRKKSTSDLDFSVSALLVTCLGDNIGTGKFAIFLDFFEFGFKKCYFGLQ